MHKFLGRYVLGAFAILATALTIALATADDVCTDASCGASGTMLLLISKSTRKVLWEGTEEEMQDEMAATRLALPQTDVSYRTDVEKVKAMANLEYDSDGDDMQDADDHAKSAEELIDLEFADQEHSADEFHKYVKGTGYVEGADAGWAPDVWNSAPAVKSSHNCYMYALNDLSPRSAINCRKIQSLAANGKLPVAKNKVNKICKRYFHKPGYFFQNVVSGRDKTDVWHREETTCRLMLPMLAADSPAMLWNNEKNKTLTEDDSCPDSHYMAALFIHPKAGFHFYRRDYNCEDNPSELCWSHKPGIMKATQVDASGKKIHRVLEADRNYGELNYSEHCAFFCVPQNRLARTHSDFRKATL